jgi:hypothetical protein
MASELTITVGLKFEKSPTTTVELSDRGSITVTGGDTMVAINSILTGIAVIAGRQAIQKLA